MNAPTRLWKNFVTFGRNHIAELMGFASGVGVVTTAILSAKGDRKAQNIWKEQEREKTDILEYLKATWSYYLPGAFSGAATIALIWGSHRLTASKIAALSSLYSLSENSLKEYKEKIETTIGDKKAETIRDKICEDMVLEHPPVESEILNPGAGSVRCLEPLTGRCFWSDADQINRAVNAANHALLSDMFMSLNTWFEFLGLMYVDDALGEEIGWNSDNMIEVGYSAQLTADKRPILVIDYKNPPITNYRSYL